ncbi:hypothetical protein JCM11754A_05230 [Isoptericola variabilis]
MEGRRRAADDPRTRVMLQGSGSKSSLKLQYLPKDPNVRSVFSNTITLRRHAP